MKCVAIVTLFLLSFGNVFAASSSHSISDSDATLHRRTPIGSSPRIKLADLRKQETAEINLFLAFGLINTFVTGIELCTIFSAMTMCLLL